MFILLSTLSQQGVQTLKSNPERLQQVNQDVAELGARVLHQWATLGSFDFVNVEMPFLALQPLATALFAGTFTLVLTLVEGPIMNRLDIPVAESWGILALHVLAVASFASTVSVLMGRWAIIPTWLFTNDTNTPTM